MPNNQKLRGLVRLIEMETDDLRATIDSLAEWETVTGVSAGAGASPTADTDDGDDLTVLEPYGFAGRPPGTAQTIAIAPGADDENRVALGLSSVAGRPVTDAGDAVVWTAAGHSIALDDDGGLTLTAKDGQVIELETSGDILLTPKAGKKVRVGGAGASQPAAKATVTRGEIVKIVTAISAVVPVGPDTGALIVAALQLAFPGPVAQLGSSVAEVVE